MRATALLPENLPVVFILDEISYIGCDLLGKAHRRSPIILYPAMGGLRCGGVGRFFAATACRRHVADGGCSCLLVLVLLLFLAPRETAL